MSDLVERLENPPEMEGVDWCDAQHIRDLLTEAAAALRAQEWVEVNERLPEYDERVLTYHDYHKRIVEAKRTSTTKQGEVWSCEYGHYITHWMPLPQPPKGVQGE